MTTLRANSKAARAIVAEHMHGKRRSKFGVKMGAEGKAERTVDGIVFDSLKEARRWGELKLLERAKKIIWLKRQIVYPLYAATCCEDRYEHGQQVVAKFKADFVYDEHNGQRWVTVVEDCKGAVTRMYALKRKMMLANYGITIRET